MILFELMGTIAINNDSALKAIDHTTSKAKGAGSDIESAFTKTGKVLTTLGTGLTKVGAGLTKYVTKPALIAGTALAGVTLAKGWARMTEIENARAKLGALGNSADDVKKIMNNALASVKGTAYGLNEAATTAASAVASGIQPGKQLEGYLRAVADTAAIAGVSMSEMGSIFNKVAAKGKVDAEILNQLSDAGVPALQLLAKELGVTTAEVSEMVSRGEVDFATFQAAMQAGMDGAAVEMGSKTITGAIANIIASIGRIGANFLGSADDANSFAGQVLPLLNDFRVWLGKGEEKAKQWGATFGEVMKAVVRYVKDGTAAFVGISPAAARIFDAIRPIIDRVKAIADAFSQLSPKMQATLVGGIVAAGPMLMIFGKLFSVVGSIIGGIGTLSATFGTMAGATGAATAATGGLAGGLGAILGPIALIVTGVIALIAVFASLYAKNEDFRNSVGEIWGSIKATIGTVIEAIKTIFSAFVELVGAIWNQWGDEITSVVTTVFAVVQPIISAAMNFIQAIIKTVTAIINGDWSAAWDGMKSVLSSAWNFIKAIVSGALTIISGKISGVWGTIKSTTASVWNAIKTAITKPIEAARDKVKSVIDKIKSFFSFSWSLPKLKLPHLKASGKFSLVPPSVPKFSISWYKKAMDNAMLLNSPTIFGYNPATGSLLGGGEAGQEVVSGSSTLMNMIRSAVSSENTEMVVLLDRIIFLLQEFFPAVINSMGRPLVLDTGALVGGTGDMYYKEMGDITSSKFRRELK